MGAGDGNVSSNVSVGTVVVAQMGGWRSVQDAVKSKYTSWWGTKGCSRGGIIFGNHRGTGLMDAVAVTHSVVVVAVLAALFRSPTEKKILASCPQALKKNRSRTRWASLAKGSVLLVSACKVAVPNVEGSGLTEMGRGQWRRWKCRQRPRPQKSAPGIISISLDGLTRSFNVTVPPMATAGEEREAHCSL